MYYHQPFISPPPPVPIIFAPQPEGWIAVNPYPVHPPHIVPCPRPPPIVQSPIPEDDTPCAHYWKNRLAPLTGRMSSRNLLATIAVPEIPYPSPVSPTAKDIPSRRRTRAIQAKVARAKALESLSSSDASSAVSDSLTALNVVEKPDLPVRGTLQHFEFSF